MSVSGRALHLLDLENLAGDPDAGREAVDAVLDGYLARAAVGPVDLVTVALNHRMYKRAFLSLARGWKVELASGTDACDRALLTGAPVDWVADRFDRLVVGSGDHAFCDLVHGVRRRATSVWVVAPPPFLSRRLAAAASRVVALPERMALAA